MILLNFLIVKGTNVNAKTKDGSIARSKATKANDTAMVKLLKDLRVKE